MKFSLFAILKRLNWILDKLLKKRQFLAKNKAKQITSTRLNILR